MGQILSGEVNKPNEEEKLNNIKKLFNKQDDTSDILESLNLTEFNDDNKENDNSVNSKKQLPMVGGFNSNGFEPNSDDKSLGRKRYTKYDLFKMLKEIDSEFQMGGNDEKEADNESSLNDEKSLNHIKSVILKELENLKQNKSHQLGGTGCGCESGDKKNTFDAKKLSNVTIDNQKQVGGNIIVDDSSSSTSTTDNSSSTDDEAGKKAKKSYKKNKKSTKKYNKHNKSESEDSSRFFIETSESGKDVTSNGDKNSDNKGEDSEGLSIFPFNSSDVNSSLSVKNYRMLRRKI